MIPKYLKVKEFFVILLIFLVLSLTSCKNNLENITNESYECNQNSDCGISGCSGQICTKSGNDVITSCEYLGVYSCYRLTSCDCVNNNCQWINNKQFNECRDKYSQ